MVRNCLISDRADWNGKPEGEGQEKDNHKLSGENNLAEAGMCWNSEHFAVHVSTSFRTNNTDVKMLD